jgi:O-acetyl-ADP-ribose deacetylase (regulator of RNase III)
MIQIYLIDKNIQMCNYWKLFFRDCPYVSIYNGDFFSMPTDCLVSPANSFGFMDGGLDYAISMQLGWKVQEKLQKQIQEKYDGELLVGQAELVETDNEIVPFIISAPTMRVPLIIKDTPNVYLASRAVFLLVKKESRIKTITMSGLGTGVGQMPYDVCAKQMRVAYDEIMIGNYIFPKSWEEAQQKHYNLIQF